MDELGGILSIFILVAVIILGSRSCNDDQFTKDHKPQYAVGDIVVHVLGERLVVREIRGNAAEKRFEYRCGSKELSARWVAEGELRAEQALKEAR